MLSVNERLRKGEQLTNRNGRFRAVMQDDGNFVLYAGQNKQLWSSDTLDAGDSVWLTEDGDLRIVDSKAKTLFASNTQNQGNLLVCKDNGNLVLLNSDGVITWSTFTAQSKSSLISS